jgi:hypothetical protein
MTVDYTFIKTLNLDFIDLLNFIERPCRAKFVPAKVWTDLDKYRDRGESLRNYFKKWKTRVVFRRDKKAQEFVLVGGEYDYDDDYMELQIYTSGHISDFTFTDETWDRFKYKLIQTLMHEFIHYMQFTNRDDPYRNYTVSWRRSGKQKLDVDREYYSSIDEIQAYAHCVLMDYYVYAGKLSLPDLLNKTKRNPSPTFREILKIFKGSDLTTVRKVREHTLRWEKKYAAAFA